MIPSGMTEAYLKNLVHLVKQLLLGERIPAKEFDDHMPGAVDLHALLRRKEKGDEGVDHQEDENIQHHQLDLRPVDLRDAQQDDRKHQRCQDDADIVGEHDGKGEQQKADQLGQPGKPVDAAYLHNCMKRASAFIGLLPFHNQ